MLPCEVEVGSRHPLTCKKKTILLLINAHGRQNMGHRDHGCHGTIPVSQVLASRIINRIFHLSRSTLSFSVKVVTC
jgi:hypothetical protein